MKEMEYNTEGPAVKPLLLIDSQSSWLDDLNEHFRFPDGTTIIQKAIQTLHSALPRATTIYMYLHDKDQLHGAKGLINDSGSFLEVVTTEHEDDDYSTPVPKLQPIFAQQRDKVEPDAGLLAAHKLHPQSKWLVLACGYTFIPPPAIQQLILEYQSPITCFVDETGQTLPFVGIWDPDALEYLKTSVESSTHDMDAIVQQLGGKLVNPLRKEWIQHVNTAKECNNSMKFTV